MNELYRRMLMLPEQASSVARDIDTLHYVVITTSVVGAVGVALAVGYFILRYRRGVSRDAVGGRPRPLPLSLEVGAIIGLLALFLVFWLVGFRQFVHLRTPPANALDVYVVSKQWMWAFAYPDGSASNGDLYVPVGRPVKLILTSRDVIHSFWVPEFRVKHDAVPGRMTFVWFEATRPGTYDILCAEYCGAYHSRMRGRVIALPPASYEQWQRLKWSEQDTGPGGQEPSLGAPAPGPRAGLAQIGVRVAGERGCLRCHTLDGTPHLGPSFAGLYRAPVRLLDGRTVVADDAYLTESMMDPLAKVRAGFSPIMPSYQGLLDAAETAAIVELIHSLADRPTPGSRSPAALALPMPPTAPAAPTAPIAPTAPTAPPTPGTPP